jgi:hypothetical protein
VGGKDLAANLKGHIGTLSRLKETGEMLGHIRFWNFNEGRTGGAGIDIVGDDDVTLYCR